MLLVANAATSKYIIEMTVLFLSGIKENAHTSKVTGRRDALI